MFVFECPQGHLTDAKKAESVACPRCGTMFRRLRLTKSSNVGDHKGAKLGDKEKR